ncbi:hypothetical protein LOZ65_005822 [Ophidiomyces ophidiicola]|nr:hypothetical protein LOZ65_005822 [Ophidiomyces ophidiicola]
MAYHRSSQVGSISTGESGSAAQLSKIPTMSSTGSIHSRRQSVKPKPLIPRATTNSTSSRNEGIRRQDNMMNNGKELLGSAKPPFPLGTGVPPLPRKSSLSSKNKAFQLTAGLSRSYPTSNCADDLSHKTPLRRKAPSIERHVGRTRSRSPSIPLDMPGKPVLQKLTQSHILAPPSPSAPLDSSQEPSSTYPPPELSRLTTTINTIDLPPPTPNFTSDSSASTRYSGSPGPWSSRTSTPTSLSSYSPGLTHSTKVSTRLRQPSPSLFRSNPPRYHVSGASYPGATPDIPIFPKVPKRSQTEPVRVTESRLPTKISGVSTRSEGPRYEVLQAPSIKPTVAETAKQIGRIRGISGKSHELLPAKRSQKLGPVRNPSPVVSSKYPHRPSRAGTEPLQVEPPPVVHSALSSSRTLEHKRHGSVESVTLYKPTRDSISFGNSSANRADSFRKASPQILHQPPSPNKFARPNPRSNILTPSSPPPLKSQSIPKKEYKDLRNTKSESKDVGTRRFGFFQKRSKTSLDMPPPEQASKQARRGPVAGTGHEGYGKYSTRGRRTSIGSNSSRARSTSTNGSTSNLSQAHPELDDFLLDRLEPVIITGGTLGRTDSKQSVSDQSIASSTNLSASTHPRLFYTQSSESLVSVERLVLSPEPMSATATFQSDLKGSSSPRVTIEKRRSVRRFGFFDRNSRDGFLSINTDIPKLASPLNSSNTCHTSMSQSDASILTRDNDVLDTKETKKKSQMFGKWNFFQRTHQLRRKEHFTKTDLASVSTLPVTVSQVPTTRVVAHYALLDDDQLDSDSLEDILHNIEESPPTEEEVYEPPTVCLKRQQSVLLPAPPTLPECKAERRPPSPKVFFNKDVSPDTQPTANKSQRPARLRSIGRIPRVTVRDDRQHKPTPQSFSRPFCRADMPSITATSDINIPKADGYFALGSCTEPDRLSFSPLPGPNIQNTPPTRQPFDSEFLIFSPRNNSEASESTSTDSQNSLKAITAVIPPPQAQLTEDEIWDEYDDFIDKVLTPPAVEEGSSGRGSFQLATRASRALQAGLNSVTDPKSSCLSECSEATTPISSLPTDSVHLSRSMVISALHLSSIAPSTPASPNDSCSNDARPSQGTDLAILDNTASHQSHQRSVWNEPEDKGPDRQQNTALLDIAERKRLGALAQANLRSGSLMTSRWLSFGRVLFSPAQSHVRTQDQSRILVIDGLGNDDWSFYCALTYPTATVYNLSGLLSQPNCSNPAAWDPPTNHHSVHHSNFENPFPFPKGFFTVAILRFPAACSEAGLKKMISECRRVLRTGGYLEMSILDVDMVNMGSRTRKTIRTLKERIMTTDPNISLKPTSDNVQRLLGKRGFQNLNRCVVVVPVAGTILRSWDTSSSGRSIIPISIATPSNSMPSQSASAIPDSDSHKRPFSDDANLSLGDLLSDPSPSASNDENITKIVARVGRWWYTRCYETPVLAEGNLDGSIWADRRVLRECQRHGTGFKLLIAYAQKPSEVNRRTMSV